MATEDYIGVYDTVSATTDAIDEWQANCNPLDRVSLVPVITPLIYRTAVTGHRGFTSWIPPRPRYIYLCYLVFGLKSDVNLDKYTKRAYYGTEFYVNTSTLIEPMFEDFRREVEQKDTEKV